MNQNQTQSKPPSVEQPREEGLSSSALFGILGPNVMAVITAAQAIRRDAEVYGLAGATNHSAVRCEVKGLCLKHWYDLCAALESLPNDQAEWEGRLHGTDTWEDIWPEHDGQMSYGADITYVEIRRKGAEALT